MRTQVDRDAMRLLRALGGLEGQALRRRIEALTAEPFPTDALMIPDKPGRYEIFESGYWIIYQVNLSDPGETVLTILLIEAN